MGGRGMTKEEKIAELINIRDNFNYTLAPREVFDDAIKALEQEPILDKITEIIEPLRHLSIDQMSDIEWDILRVIDKYKAESEG